MSGILPEGDALILPKGWEFKKLKDIISIKHGYAFKSDHFITDYNGSNPIVLTPGNFSEESTLYFSEKNTKRCISNFPKEFLFNRGDLVLVMTDLSSKMKILGRPAIVEQDNILHNQRIGRVFIQEKGIDIRFLFHYFNNDKYLKEIRLSATGTMVKHTAPKRILNNIIPLPPLLKQKQIIAKLDKAFVAIDQAKANIERNIVNAKELFQSKLNEIFSQIGEEWEEKTLGELADFKNGLNFTKSSKGQYIKVVGVGDFLNNFYIPTDQLNSINIDGKISTIYRLEDDDLLVVRSNGNPNLIGRCMLAKNVEEGTSHSGFTIRIRPHKDSIFSPYLCFYVKSEKAKNHLIDNGSGISIKSLNQKALSSLIITFPSDKRHQEDISNTLFKISDNTEKLIWKYKSKYEELKDLKESILQMAFKGELL